MTRVLVAAAALALTASGAFACDFHKSAHLDGQTVASVTKTEATQAPMSTSDELVVQQQAKADQAPVEATE